MRFVWIAALKDLRILRREPFSVATWVGIPLCIGMLIQLIFGGGGAHPQGVLLVADQDRTIASRFLTNAFGSEELGRMIKVETVDAKTGRERIDRGDGSALLVIPSGLQDAFLKNQPCRLELFKNAGQQILPNIIEQSLRVMVDGAFYLQRVASNELRSLNATGSGTDAEVARNAVEMRHLSRDLSGYFSPPLIAVETIAEQEPGNRLTVGDRFFPNLIFLSLLLMANGLSTEIWKERLFGTLRRVAVSPAPVAAFLAGRVLMVALAYSMVAVVSLVVAKYLASVAVPNMLIAAAWAAVSGTVFYLLLLPMAVTSPGQRFADVRGNLLVFPLAMLGGCFFPFDVLPDWMVRIGRWTPNGMAVIQFQNLLRGTADWRHGAAVLAALLLLGMLAFWLSVRRLKGEFLR
ncbi:MAG TPA: ABC transporter permease [Verrucomicrobiae bacterium]|nr:ABC transporter permease [Verrucomicrobiae bacterium]